MNPATIALLEALASEILKIIEAERAGKTVSAADVLASLAVHDQGVTAAHAAAVATEDKLYPKVP